MTLLIRGIKATALALSIGLDSIMHPSCQFSKNLTILASLLLVHYSMRIGSILQYVYECQKITIIHQCKLIRILRGSHAAEIVIEELLVQVLA